MTKIKCIIIDDEIHSIGVTTILLEEHCPMVELKATFTDSIDAYTFLKENEIDLVFIDIEMPRLNGFELLEKLENYSFKPVILSAYDEFGIKAVKHQIFDYLVKPIDPNELKATIEKYIESTEGNQSVSKLEDRILLPQSNRVDFVRIEDIVRCESEKNYTTVFLNNGTSILVSKTMKSIEDVLPNALFLRVHNKHLINASYIRTYHKTDGGYFEMYDGFSVPLSRYKKDMVLRKLGLRI